NSFSDNYDELFLKNLQEFANNIGNIKDNYVTFYPMFGVKKGEPVDFIFYGQAVNGWGSYLNETPTMDTVLEAKNFSNEYLESRNHSPIDWVNIQWSQGEFNKYIDNNDKEILDFYNYKDCSITKEDGQTLKYKTHSSFFWNVI